MLVDDRHSQVHRGNTRVGRSSGTRGYSFGVHERSAWIAARSDPPPDADSRPYRRGSEEGPNIFTVARTEKVEKVRPLAKAARRKRRATVKQNTPLEKLDDKLLKKENLCLELRQKIDAKKQEVPVKRSMGSRRALSSPHLSLKQRALVPDSDGESLQTLEAELLRKEEECAKELESLILLILDL